MIKRIAVFSLEFHSFGANSYSEIFVKLPIEVKAGTSVNDGCEALADKLGLYFCYTEDYPEETFD